MATNLQNINTDLPQGYGKGLKIGIVRAEWHNKITEQLYKGATEMLLKYGAEFAKVDVPGSVELVYGAKKMIQTGTFNAIIVFGCVIQGETKHFDYVCNFVTDGIRQLNILFDVPVIFGVLTVNNLQQAEDRAGGKLGNKGSDCAIDAMKMAKINKNIWNFIE